jgi:hypothetical protein
MEALPSNRSIIATITDKMDKIQTKSYIDGITDPRRKKPTCKSKSSKVQNWLVILSYLRKSSAWKISRDQLFFRDYVINWS